MTYAYFAQSIDSQKQNVERKVFSQKGIDTELLIKISEVLNFNFFDCYKSDSKSNYFRVQKELKATLTIEMGEEKQDKTFSFLFGENNIKIKDNNVTMQ